MSFLGLESLLIDRLRTRVSSARAVYAQADLAALGEAQQVSPALHVIYGGYKVVEVEAKGATAAIDQTWIIIVAVRHARQSQDGASAVRGEADVLCDAVLVSLLGWQPDPAGYPLELAEAPRPGANDSFGYFPIAFRARMLVFGSQP